jgi:single-stranded-DNA-specific exonuclease
MERNLPLHRVDRIITDHHDCRDELPNAVLVVDPKRRMQLSHLNLAGGGSPFKLVSAMDGRRPENAGPLRDLCRGTVADVRPLVGRTAT